MFGHSMIYLFGLFLAILIDKLVMAAGYHIVLAW
jgi:hypothetical protein